MHSPQSQEDAATAAPSTSIFTRVERAVGLLTAGVAGTLVIVETLLLFAGVMARYVLHEPLVWSDELASILFLWLAMLGAVIAYQKSEHMRMSALVNRARPARKAFFEAFSLVTGVVFLALVLNPAIEYAIDEMMVVTPALEIPNIWRASALPIGVGLMLVLGVMRLFRQGSVRDVLGALVLVGAVTLALWMATPLLTAMGNYRLIVFFVLLVGALVLSGAPIVFSFGLATFAFLALTTRTPLTVVVSRIDEGMSHIILLSVPLFVFLGLLIELSGMARAMVNFLASLIGHLRGGLSYVLLAGMYLVSGISGSKAADMAAIAPVLFPEMKKRGENPGNLVALLSASGAMSETIPPSLVLITIGSVTGVSIAGLFTGGLVPALVLAASLCVIVWWKTRQDDLSGVRRSSPREILVAFLVALPGIALPFLIRAAVVEGVATATEVSTIGIIYSAVYAVVAAVFFRQKIEWHRLRPMLVETASLSGAILIIIGSATAMAWSLTQSGFSRELAASMAKLPGGATSFMAVSVIAFIVLGSVLEGIPAIVLFGPLLFPIARQLGIHDIQYSMVVVLAMGIGLFAPPFGVGYYAACAIGRVDPSVAFKPIWPYLAAMTVGLVLVAAIPWLSVGFL